MWIIKEWLTIKIYGNQHFLVSTHVIGRHSFKNKEKKIIPYEKSSIHGGLVYGINTAIIFISKGDNHGCRDVTG